MSKKGQNSGSKTRKINIEALNRVMMKAVDEVNKKFPDEPKMEWTPMTDDKQNNEGASLSPWYQDILDEFTEYQEDEETIHNTAIHQRILEAWKQNSPSMYQRLNMLGILEAMAYVSQQRMWQAMDSYMEMGYPVIDAREQAERDHLMLEPESDDSEF